MNFLIKTLVLLSFAGAANAGLSDDLNKSFNNMGMSANITPADVYRGQEGPFAYGGSAYMRTQHESIQPMWYQPPGWRVGDCDMDLWTGGFGFLSSAKYVDMLKKIGTNATAYFFSLALKQIQPQIMNQIEALQAMANNINKLNIESCEAAKYFVNSGIDVVRSSANKSCQTKGISANSNDYGSSINAREECNKPAEANRLAKEASDDPGLKDQTLIDKNIAWSAIQNNDALKNLDIETKYFLMSLTGTVVITQPAGANAPTELVYVSKLDSDTLKLMDALSNAGKVKLYTCMDNTNDKCLKVEEREIILDKKKTIYGQVFKMLSGIAQKVIKDQALSDAEKGFIASVDFEIYKLIKLQAAFTRKVSLEFVGEYADIIAMELLYQYLDQCISDVEAAFSNNQLPAAFSKKFNAMMKQAKIRMQSVRELSAQKAMQRGEMRMRAEVIQNQLTANISQQIFSKMAWNKSLRGG